MGLVSNRFLTPLGYDLIFKNSNDKHIFRNPNLWSTEISFRYRFFIFNPLVAMAALSPVLSFTTPLFFPCLSSYMHNWVCPTWPALGWGLVLWSLINPHKTLTVPCPSFMAHLRPVVCGWVFHSLLSGRQHPPWPSPSYSEGRELPLHSLSTTQLWQAWATSRTAVIVKWSEMLRISYIFSISYHCFCFYLSEIYTIKLTPLNIFVGYNGQHGSHSS